MMLAKYSRTVGARGRMERRIVAALLDHLQAAGFHIEGVDDGEDFTVVSTTKDAMELIFNLDDARVRVGGHHVALVLGEGEDILSDWSYSKSDADGFNAAMEAFDVDGAK